MLLDCARLDWKIENIIDELDKGEKKDIKYGVPFKWNSLEHYDDNTCLIHYTDMATQPWVSCKNRFGYLWLNELRLMLKNNSISMSEIQKEIDLGFFRPSLFKLFLKMMLLRSIHNKIYSVITVLIVVCIRDIVL